MLDNCLALYFAGAIRPKGHLNLSIKTQTQTQTGVMFNFALRRNRKSKKGIQVCNVSQEGA